MRANYHTHTARCGHAFGEDQDYVESAVAAGLEILGFSDHAPYDFQGADHYPGVRMGPEELDGYVASLLALRERYADKIEMHIGFEAEYYPKLFPKLIETLRARPIEYLLLGQHFPGNETGEPGSAAFTTSKRMLDRYVGQCIEGMQTGMFTYFAHPDLINFHGDDAEYARQMRRLCRAAMDAGMPLEINLLGLSEGRNYPDERFWRIVGEEGNAVVLGCDAHWPSALRVPETEARAMELVRRFSLRLTDTVELRSLG